MIGWIITGVLATGAFIYIMYKLEVSREDKDVDYWTKWSDK